MTNQTLLLARTNYLTDSTRKYRRAQAQLDVSRAEVARAVRDAIEAGMSQSEAARIVGVDRLTIRKWIGA